MNACQDCVEGKHVGDHLKHPPVLDTLQAAVERAALLHVVDTYPRSMDLPTVLWGASAALLALRYASPTSPEVTS